MPSKSEIAVSVRGLSKSYTIAHDQEKHVTLAEQALSRLRGFVRSPTSVFRPRGETFWALKDIEFDIKKGDVVGACPIPKASEASVRYHFIDGLRGIAALLVLVFHIWHNAGLADVEAHSPHWLSAFLMSCGSGVDIFFVISGFVIAHSVRAMVVGAGTAGNFALRRQVRLDPPYWLCSFVCFGLTALAAHRMPSAVHRPSVLALAANLFYLQGLLHLPSMDPVAWTLCLEVQFYLVFIGIMWLAQRLPTPQSKGKEAVAVLVCILAVFSLGWNCFGPPTAWFIGTWYLFALGAVCYWAYARHIHPALFFGLLILVFSLDLRPHFFSIGALIGPTTGAALFAVGRTGRLTNWLSRPIFRYFAAISYSLYLVHFYLVSSVFREGMRLSGRSAISGVLWALIAAALAIAVAHCLWFFVERPAKRLSTALKSKRPIIAITLRTPTPAL